LPLSSVKYWSDESSDITLSQWRQHREAKRPCRLGYANYRGAFLHREANVPGQQSRRRKRPPDELDCGNITRQKGQFQQALPTLPPTALY
jgi:hypothetical protein